MSKFIQVENSKDLKHRIYNVGGLKLKLRLKNKITQKDVAEYLDYIMNQQLDRSNFVKPVEDKYVRKDGDVKPIAFYLPQFHDFEENIKWFGRGFSEWSNTSKTVPQYTGHWQPHIPIDVGYYTLNDNTAFKRQIELAKHYGIYGFCFYYYWFSGAKLMEKPLERFLADKSLDMPFFFFWANEDWSMLWDNGEFQEVLHRQEILSDDAVKFMKDILPYMKDSRYIRIDNKPLLVIYDVKKYTYEKYMQFVKRIREIAKENGFDDLYIMTTVREWMNKTNLKEITDKYNLDSLLEFSPQGCVEEMKVIPRKYINPKFKGKNFDAVKYIENNEYIYDVNTKIFKGCFTNWDNTSRRCYNGAYILELTPRDYEKYLEGIIRWTKENKPQNEQYVFINAWNEWAEGTHLEPDAKYGYAYLRATKEVLENA